MEFVAEGVWVFLHILFAAIWFGGGLFQILIVGPALKQSGPQGAGFLATVMKRGGIGRYFGIAGVLTIVFGAIAYVTLDYQDLGMEGVGLWVNLGAAVAVLTLLHGIAVNMPAERKIMTLMAELKGPPTPAQAQQLQALGMRMGKNGLVSMVMLATAMVLMLMSNVYV